MERLLTGRDRQMLERFLSADAASTMFLRSNLRVGTITPQPEGHFDGAYVGAFDSGLLVGVACHAGNGMLLGHGHGLGKATARAVKSTGAPIRGLTADLDAVSSMLEGLSLKNASVMHDSHELLYELALDELVEPPVLERARCRLPENAEIDKLAAWREAYCLETMGVVWGSPRDAIIASIERGGCRVLEVDGELVSYCHQNAKVLKMVQIGGVWTPRELRGRGYARAVVAGSLLDARDAGMSQAILFTARSNRPAQRAYEALGFEVIGDTRLVIFDPPVTAG